MCKLNDCANAIRCRVSYTTTRTTMTTTATTTTATTTISPDSRSLYKSKRQTAPLCVNRRTNDLHMHYAHVIMCVFQIEPAREREREKKKRERERKDKCLYIYMWSFIFKIYNLHRYCTCQQNHVPSPVQPWKVPTTNYYQLLFPPQSFHIVDLQRCGHPMREESSAPIYPRR